MTERNRLLDKAAYATAEAAVDFFAGLTRDDVDVDRFIEDWDGSDIAFKRTADHMRDLYRLASRYAAYSQAAEEIDG